MHSTVARLCRSVPKDFAKASESREVAYSWETLPHRGAGGGRLARVGWLFLESEWSVISDRSFQ